MSGHVLGRKQKDVQAQQQTSPPTSADKSDCEPSSGLARLAGNCQGQQRSMEVRLSPREERVTSMSRPEEEDTVKYWHYKQTGIKSRPIKPLRHPIEHIERKIVLTYLVGIVFKLIAILSGPLIVLLLHLITLPVLLGQRATWFLLNLRFLCNARIRTTDIDSLEYGPARGPRREDDRQVFWQYCPLNFLETYWFKERLVNTVILVLKEKRRPGGPRFELAKLRQLFAKNLLSKPAYRKFLSRVVERGLPLFKALYWQHLGLLEQPDSPIDKQASDQASDSGEPAVECAASGTSSSSPSISSHSASANLADVRISLPAGDSSCQEPVDLCRHIFMDCARATDMTSVRRHAHSLLEVALDPSRPLWELRVMPSTSESRRYLIFRCHQSLADGRGLVELLTVNLAANQADPGSPEEDDQDNTGSDSELKPIKDKKSFIAKVSRSSGFRSAMFVGPLTVLLWMIWAFARRKNNHLNRCSFEEAKVEQSGPNVQKVRFKSRRFSIAQYSLTKFYQIKQMTRSTVNDVILCALSGALRNYLNRYNAIPNPPNLNISLTVDMRPCNRPNSNQANEESDLSGSSLGSASLGAGWPSPDVNTTMVSLPLPSSVEGAVPRLWELRGTMEELRASADPWVMLGLQRFLHLLLPAAIYRWLVNHVAMRNSSAFISTIRGPINLVESWCVDLAQRAIFESQQPPKIFRPEEHKSDGSIIGDHGRRSRRTRARHKASRLKLRADLGSLSAIFYCMQPPSGNIPISFNCITYHDKIFITSLSRSLLVEDSKLLIRLFLRQLNQLAGTIARRRSLLTYVQCPMPIEINCEPPSPKGPIEFTRVLPHQSRLDLRDQEEGKLAGEGKSTKGRRGSLGMIECLGSGGHLERDRCRSCESKICGCKRRKSLFAIEAGRQRPANLLGLFNPGQMMSLHRSRSEASQERRSQQESEYQCDGHFL